MMKKSYFIQFLLVNFKVSKTNVAIPFLAVYSYLLKSDRYIPFQTEIQKLSDSTESPEKLEIDKGNKFEILTLNSCKVKQ